MSSTTASVLYDNKSVTNFKAWDRYILRKLDNHSDKLLSVATSGKLDIVYRAKFRSIIKSDIKDITDANLDIMCNEQYEACNKSTYLMIVETISDKTTLSHIERDYDSKGYEAYKYICGLWKVEDNENRIDRVKNERDAHIATGMTDGSHKAATAWVEELQRLNSELYKSTFYLDDPGLVKTVLSQVSRFHTTTVNAYRAAKVATPAWKADFKKVWDEISDLLESQDSDAKIQHGPTDVLTTSTDQSADLQAQLAKALATIEPEAADPDPHDRCQQRRRRWRGCIPP